MIIMTEEQYKRLEEKIVEFRNNAQMKIDTLQLENEKLKKENEELSFLKSAKQLDMNRFNALLKNS